MSNWSSLKARIDYCRSPKTTVTSFILGWRGDSPSFLNCHCCRTVLKAWMRSAWSSALQNPKARTYMRYSPIQGLYRKWNTKRGAKFRGNLWNLPGELQTYAWATCWEASGRSRGAERCRGHSTAIMRPTLEELSVIQRIPCKEM